MVFFVSFPIIFAGSVFGFMLDIKSLQDFRLDYLSVLLARVLIFCIYLGFRWMIIFFFNFRKLPRRVRIAFFQTTSKFGFFLV